ncbi:MAG TPA: TonB-dependent receptor, partial [Vicinamibacterales bacterium]|nr:TonB-dependent receptor [Vicinamibacterales bacterium]
GVVVDQDARPIPRALVTATDASGRELARTFTARDGSFTLPQVAASSDCFLTAQLTGFLPVHTDCGAGGTRRIVLAVAPLEEVIIVSATRGEAPAAQVAPSTTVYTARDMDRRQRPLLPDLLRTSAGTTVVGAGGPGGVTSLFVRGGESSYTKVLLDGIPLNDPGGAFDFSNVTTAHLGRVELVRGAHSALFGTDAVAGVLQMFTARARPGDPSTEIHFDGGTLGTMRAGVTYSRASHVWDYSLHASSLTTDNDVPNNEFSNTTLSAAGGAELNERTSLRFVARGEIGDAGAPGQVAFGRPDRDAAYERRYGVFGASFRQQLSAALHHSARYSFSASNQASVNLVEDPPYTPRFGDRAAPFEFFDFLYDTEDRLRRHHAGYQVDWRLLVTAGRAGLHLFTAAVEWDGERATLEDRLSSDVTRASRDNVGATLQHQILWPRLFLTGGLRLQHNESFGSAAVPRISAAFIARDSDAFFGTTRIKAAAGAGVKAPTIRQSFSRTPFALGNPDLAPERSRTLDAGIEQKLAGGAALLEVTWFANRFRDIISTETLSVNPFRSQYFNIGLTRARGVEIAGELSHMLPGRVRGGYTYMRSRVLESASPDDPVFGVGRGLFRRPQHSGFVDVEINLASLAVTAVGTFTGRSVDSDFSEFVPPLTFNEGHKRWDLRASYELSLRLRLLAAVDNLLNNRYMEPLGYRVPGRIVRAGVDVTF